MAKTIIRSAIRIPLARVCLALLVLPCAEVARAQAPDCVNCHEGLLRNKAVHAALQTGCKTCHGDLDAGSVPHRSRGKSPKGLGAEPPALCHKCHEARGFEGKVAHAPVAGGLCTTCHDPHASQYPALAPKPTAALCLDCHSYIRNKPHVISGFSRGGHPLGDEPKPVQDPLRPGRHFDCTSCHEPHRADHARLMRVDSHSLTGFCQKCHSL